MHDYKVSVIIPNYNHAPYLDQRIKSVLNQTYQNFELIILDDCSPDNGASKEVIEKYRNNPHVSHIVYNETNSGSTFKQWDLGISLAKGELIWIAESDDYCELNFLERLVPEFENDSKLSLVYSPAIKVDKEGKDVSTKNINFRNAVRLSGKEYVRRYMCLGNHCNNASAALFRKSVFGEIDKGYTLMKAAGDYLFWIEIAEYYNVAIINERLSYFRQHDNKVTPEKMFLGVNDREAFQTKVYIADHFGISQFKQKLMYCRQIRQIRNRKYRTDEIKKELLNLYYSKSSYSAFCGLIAKFLEILCHRLNLYI